MAEVPAALPPGSDRDTPWAWPCWPFPPHRRPPMVPSSAWASASARRRCASPLVPGSRCGAPMAASSWRVRRAVTLQPVTLQPVAPHRGHSPARSLERLAARQPGASNADARAKRAGRGTPESPAPAPKPRRQRPMRSHRAGSPGRPLLSATDTSDGEAPALAIPFSTLRIVPHEEGAPPGPRQKAVSGHDWGGRGRPRA